MLQLPVRLLLRYGDTYKEHLDSNHPLAVRRYNSTHSNESNLTVSDRDTPTMDMSANTDQNGLKDAATILQTQFESIFGLSGLNGIGGDQSHRTESNPRPIGAYTECIEQFIRERLVTLN